MDQGHILYRKGPATQPLDGSGVFGSRAAAGSDLTVVAAAGIDLPPALCGSRFASPPIRRTFPLSHGFSLVFLRGNADLAGFCPRLQSRPSAVTLD
jgi:hypothetical protein